MKRITAIFILLFAPLTWAQDPSAYLSRITVADESSPERNRALREGLMQVARHITGDERLMRTSQGQNLLGRANRLTRSVGYDMTEDGQKQLVVDFDPVALDTALQQAGFPVFGVYARVAASTPVIIRGLRSGADYARAVGHLRGQAVTQSITVLRSKDGQLDLQLTVTGGSSALSQALLGSSVLQAESDETGSLIYRIKL